MKILLLFIGGLFASAVTAHPEPSCAAWHLAAYLKKRQLKQLDPSDAAALQNLLRKVHDQPTRELSSEERKWVEEFSLHGALAQVRAAGEEVLRTRRRHQIGKVIIATAGASGLTVIAGKRGLEIFGPPATVEQELNRTYGLSLAGNDESDLRVLKKILDCNPQAELMRSRDSLQKEAFKSKNYGSGADLNLQKEKSALALTSRLLFDTDYSQVGKWSEKDCGGPLPYGDFRQFINDLILRYDVPLCSRWGTPSSRSWTVSEACPLLTFFNSLSPEWRESMRDVDGIVVLPPSLQPKIIRKGHMTGQAAAYYSPATKRIEYYSGGIGTLLHELGHHMSHATGAGDNRRWNEIMFRFVPGQGWTARDGVNFPSEYAKADPEECWAEYVRVYFIGKWSRSFFRETNPAAYHYFEEMLAQRGMQPLPLPLPSEKPFRDYND